MASVLRGTIDFLQDFGLFDVILPFLLIFAIIFAILEKTLILGKDKEGMPQKNLNSIVALVVALLFVSANKAVNLIATALPNIALMIVVGLSFLLMLGIFWKSEEFDFKSKSKGWYITFSIIMFIALIFIFLGAYEVAPGESMLSQIFDSVEGGIFQDVLVGIVVLAAVIGIIVYVTHKPKGGDE
jgi:hypothetical protein